jgi:hypothetical protein
MPGDEGLALMKERYRAYAAMGDPVLSLERSYVRVSTVY